ncbi:MAG TPA: GNAT family N-acetyltransferase [Micromonosporaceae bacterium]|nr:GNAT family N-acetyltransferase [Micromonosporaceae bacterium]
MTAASDAHTFAGPAGGPINVDVAELAGGVDALAADGAIIRIRPVRAGDAVALTDLHERASNDTLYRRFLSAGHHPIAGEVARLVRTPDADHAALVAVERGRVVGVSSYEVLPGRRTAEFAVFVDDACHGRGIGTLLLEHLAVWGRRHGIPDFLGEVLPTNSSMLRVASNLGQPIRSKFDLGLIEVHLDTELADSNVVDVRDAAAARHSLDSLFAPRTIAIVGDDWTPGGASRTLLDAIVEGTFAGTVYAVGASDNDDLGAPTYSSIDAAPSPDLVIITAAAAAVPAALASAGESGARVALVASGGFDGDGPESARGRAELVRIARTGGMRLVGPSSLGVVNTAETVSLHATSARAVRAGGLAVAAQSGAVGSSLLGNAYRHGLGIATFVSLGNKADVSGNDLLSYWYDDPAAKAVALYLESLGNPRRFGRIARAVARRKPVLVIKSGRRGVGGATGTTDAAHADVTVDTLFAQAGVIRCDGLSDLVATARVLIDQPMPAGDRIAIVGNAGGINVLCADAAESASLTVPTLPDEVQKAIRSAVPGCVAAANPVDLGATATADQVRGAMAAVAPYVDAIVVALGSTPGDDVPDVVTAIGRTIDEFEMPLVVVLLGVEPMPMSLGRRGVALFDRPETAIGALGRAVRYARWRASPLGQRPALAGIDAFRARRLVDDALRSAGDVGAPEDLGPELLRCYGIPIMAAPAAVAAPAGVEMVVGVAHDPLFGSVLTCGVAGIATELLGDRSRRVLPLTDVDAAGMWRDLKAAPMLTGHRGSTPVDTAAVEDLLLRLARLAEELPEVAALDLDPVVAGPDGAAVAGVEVRLATVGREPDAGLRALREPD